MTNGMSMPKSMGTRDSRKQEKDRSQLHVFLFGNRFQLGLLNKAIVYGSLILLGVLFMIPFYWMLNTALKSRTEVFTLPATWFPSTPQTSNFIDALTGRGEELTYIQPFYRYFLNTLVITVNGVLATLLSSSMVAYAFARLDFPGRDKLFLGIVSTLMVPFAVTMVPQFIIWSRLNWLNTLWPLLIPHWFGSPWNIFLLRQFFLAIPNEYDEAALLDGASRWRIYWSIILPLSKPALAAVGVFAFVYHWNDFLAPLIILSAPSKFTLTMFLANFSVAYTGSTPWNLYMAAALIIILPCLLLFFFLQEAFLTGITLK
jgi:multiple sugar transport system permease protein